MKPTKTVVYTGIGPITATFLAFLVLKLTGHIDWSWWWVTSPLWIPLLIPIVIVLAVLLVCLVIALVAG